MELIHQLKNMGASITRYQKELHMLKFFHGLFQRNNAEELLTIVKQHMRDEQLDFYKNVNAQDFGDAMGILTIYIEEQKEAIIDIVTDGNKELGLYKKTAQLHAGTLRALKEYIGTDMVRENMINAIMENMKPDTQKQTHVLLTMALSKITQILKKQYETILEEIE